jgi:tight adherence protein B
MVLILLGTLASVVLFVAGARNLVEAGSWQRELSALVYDDQDGVTSTAVQRYDRRFRRTRAGQWVAHPLVLSGISYPPVLVAGATLLGGLLAAYLLAKLMAPVFGLLGLLGAVQGLRVFLARARDKRREDFIGQMPELARVLANATSAGLSIRTAVEMAGEELAEPAATEMRRVASSMKFGATLDESLDEITRRLPSREIAVLISTLLVSARSGGSLVSSLRDIADTLETRKEVRREIRTLLAQSVITGYMVMAMGVGLLIMINTIRPGTINLMTRSLLGQGTFVVAALLYAAGLLAIRRITRIEP